MTPHAFDCPEADRLVDDALRAIGAEIDALRIPRLLGVVLGGGYARGEGGVFDAEGAAPRLSNDLDFYVVAEDGSSGADLAAIAAALRPVSEKWTARLGVDVDFSPPKTPWRIAHDAERLMIQELLHGYCDVAGKPGSELFAGVARREPSALPAMEAVRLLVNRGAGLLLAAESGASPDFVARNINKAILGCGDARLIAEGRYRWRALDRADALADDLYRAAVQWKFRPRPEPPCDWEAARDAWLETVESVCSNVRKFKRSNVPSPQVSSPEPSNLGTFEPANGARSALSRRTPRAAARWLVRRRSLGPAPLRTLGLDPLVRILDAMRPLVRDRKPFPASLRRDWEVFN